MARHRTGTHNARRRFVEAQVLRALADEYHARLGGAAVDGTDDPPTAEEQRDLAQRLRRVPEVADALDRMWPRLSARKFLHDLLGARALLTAAGKGVLSASDGAAALPAPQRVAEEFGAVDGRRCRPHQQGARTLLRDPVGEGPARTRAKRAEGAPRPDGVLAARSGGLSRAAPSVSTAIGGRGPGLRPHRGRRGAGPLADAVAHAGPPVAVGLHDSGGRHRPGHGALGARRVGRRRAVPEPPATGPGWWSSR